MLQYSEMCCLFNWDRILSIEVGIHRMLQEKLHGSSLHYESSGYLIIRSVKNKKKIPYIRTIVGRISLYREIEEVIQGFLFFKEKEN